MEIPQVGIGQQLGAEEVIQHVDVFLLYPVDMLILPVPLGQL
jgi:hypothetical protein